MSAQIAPVVQSDPKTEEESKAKEESLFLTLPTSKEVVYDPASKRYIIKEKIGEVEVNTPLFMSTSEYKEYRLKEDMRQYYKDKISALNSDKEGSKEAQKNLLPTYYVNSSLFKTIFGGNAIEVNTQGSIDVRLGVLYQNIENPQLSEENRKNITFDFDQQVTASIGAKIGERLRVTANYDTKSTFDFQNLVKVEFLPTIPTIPTEFESKDVDDIIRKVELGNVSMDVSNNLISGSQSLFGFKSKLQFGKTEITSVFSEQKSETKTVTAEGGASLNEFELQTSQYAANKYFFLSHYFRNNYNTALEKFPLINSSVNIIRVEVWITNRGSNTIDVRNIVALTDLGEKGFDYYVNSETGVKESNISNVEVLLSGTYPYENPDNAANTLSTVFDDPNIRDIGSVRSALPSSMIQGSDYTILENAKKLNSNEFSFHPQLGVLTLNRNLTDGDVLAVSFQYTLTGNETVFQVGELSSDGIASDDNLVVKMLRSEIKEPGKRIWDLMMKNIYSLGAYQLQSEGFLLDLFYKDDQTGVAVNTLQNSATPEISSKTIMHLARIDILDQNNFEKDNGDGYFDYVEGITVDSQTGSIMFPTVEPFGRDMEAKLTDASDDLYLFKELYTETQANARNNYQNRDKYVLRGYYKSDASDGISLGAFNVPRGSVTVTSNGIVLTEGADYVVDYLSGKVQIINPAIEASGAPVQVSLENNSVFNQQTKRYVGIDVEHKFSEKFQMTGTYLNVNERPLTQKVSYGADPIDNTMLGMSFNYDSEIPWLTKMVNKLPFQDTDVPSQLTVRGDFAYMLPGTPSGVNQGGEATTYIDDFEGAQIPLNIMDVNSWKLASKPLNFTLDGIDYNLGLDNGDPSLDYGKNRAQLAWYSIDRLFYGSSSLTPGNIDNEELSRAEVSRVDFDELFPQTDLDLTQSNTLSTFDLSYFPKERGSYNYDDDFDVLTGDLNSPEDRWGGITRGLTTTDFERANVEYIQFWLQDPYQNYSIDEREGFTGEVLEEGELFFNLGNISEDVLKDGRKMYENGLPESGEEDNTVETIWGRIPTNIAFLYAFNEVDADRLLQDVGLDGLGDEGERLKFGDSRLDPSSDNYRFFRSSIYDDEDASIVSRYKAFNNTEGNSPTANLSPESYPTSATAVADAEDINKDQTMNTIDAYFQYKVSLNSSDLNIDNKHIVDVKNVVRNIKDIGTQEVTWYQFRIPISSGTSINGISDLNSIRFMRMFLTKFKTPVVLRFGQLQLVRGDWRRYDKNVHGGIQVEDDDLEPNELNNFSTGVVNIEENSGRQPIPYIEPPGIQREQLQGSTKLQLQNEQSLSVKIVDLPPGEARSVFKNMISDLRMYKRLKMFVHAEGITDNFEDDKMMAIVRLGADLNDNYYQIELPLKRTRHSESSKEDVWPEENDIEVDLESLGLLKVQRYAESGSSGANVLYPLPVDGEEPKYRIRVKGNPNLANIKTMMMGVQNISEEDQSAEIWFNELRVAGFDNDGGWATVVSANANFADLADVALTGSMSTIGFGGVEERVNERSLENIKQYGVSTNINVGKLMPKDWGVQIPLSYSVSEEFKDPKYDPKFQDVLFDAAKDINENSNSAQDYTKRRSISLINVRKERIGTLDKVPMPYDIENFSASYSYNEQKHKDYNVQKHLVQDVRTSANYGYNIPSKSIEPFKNSKSLNSKYFKLIKEFNFNPLPTTIGVNSNITRNYNEQASRNLVTGGALPTLQQRNFLFDWDYNIGYNLTKSLTFNFRAANKHIYDSFETLEDSERETISLYSNFFNFGRANNYNQKLDAAYKIPIDKLPYLSFMTADYSYTADFSWEAASQSFIYEMGNAIQNANTHSLSSNLNMTKFYKEIKLKSLFTPKSKKKKKKKKSDDGKPKFAMPTVPIKINSKKKKSTTEKILDVTYDLLTSIKTVQFSYAENNGTYLPGYKQSVGFLGRDRSGGGVAPTFGFVFGDQADIRQEALNSNWLTTRNINLLGVEDENYYSKTYTNTHYDKLDWSMSLKPIKDLDITITANRIQTRNKSQQIDPVKDFTERADGNYDGIHENGSSYVQRLETTQLSETSNFSMSYNMFKTSFDGNGDATFRKFLDNRALVQSRLAANSGLDVTKYGLNTQDVLLPSFTAAYSGGSASSEKLQPFKDVPLPNWRLSYKGFMKIKWFKKNFSNFTITHAYSSSYTIGNMSNNIQYLEDENKVPPVDVNGNYISKVLVSTIALSDGFSPLVKVDMKLKNSLSFRGEVNKDRMLALSFNNNSMSDIRGTEYVFGLGYIIKDLKLRSSSGRRKALKGNLNMKADISYRQNLTTIRTIDTENTQVTGGQNIFSLKMSADYNLNKNLIATFYYDQSASRFAISTSFPRQSVSSGISITYNLGN
jgi:cell surface protein SprA